MKFYIAARTAKAVEVRKMRKILEEKGHRVSYDWTLEDVDIPRPYGNHVDKVVPLAEKTLEGAKNADIFIIIGDSAGTGMYVELGAALAAGKKVYAIEDHNDKTVFHFHPLVTRLNTFEDVLKELGG